ncbi:hypothetical protein [Nocardia otitidiscaviarum]|uniref:hypothetical protein n=1 Tax=Nocardia otitidiscaviarum TaxID=1823 RepID=UPI001E422E23|nr:hypothetical protein [Nocardia otitidiscaviarum]
MSTETPEPTETTPRPAARQRPGSPPRTLSIPLPTSLRAGLAVVFLAASVVFAGLWWSADRDLDRRDAMAADLRHAEQVATDYAVGASTIDYQDFPAWMAKLGTGTTAELAAKFEATGPALEQLLTPLRWTSTATPIAARAESASDGVYRVAVFLDVTSASAQTPDGARTTVTYRVTVDRDADWRISDVSGMDGALPGR